MGIIDPPAKNQHYQGYKKHRADQPVAGVRDPLHDRRQRLNGKGINKQESRRGYYRCYSKRDQFKLFFLEVDDQRYEKERQQVKKMHPQGKSKEVGDEYRSEEHTSELQSRGH